MDAALAVSALLMGLAGSPHCTAMCGAACAAVAGPQARAPALVALHAGRVAGYASAGAIAAAGLAGLGSLATAAPLVRPLWSIVHVAAIALGACGQPIRLVRTLPRPAAAALAGACWVAIPCGLLQAALLVAALASTPATGAATMAAFAAGSSAALMLAQGAWSRLQRIGTATSLAPWTVRIAGALLASSSAFALWSGLGEAICSAIAA
jgi:sulfite exporter TauE/SafE